MSPAPFHSLGRDDDRNQVVVPLARAPTPDGPRQTETSAMTRRTLNRRWVVVSILAHAVIIVTLLIGLLEAPQPVPVPVLKITLVPQGPGGEGVAGGKAEVQGPQPSDEATASADATLPPEPAKPEIPAPAPEPIAAPTPPTPEIPTPTKPTEIPPTPPEPVKPPQPTPVPKPPQPMATVPQIAIAVPPPKPRHIPPRHQPARHREAPARVTPAIVTTPTPAPTAPAQTSPAAAPATPGVGAGPGKGVEGAGKGAIGNTPGPGDDYLDRLYRHLLRYKKYPPEAISAKQQGSVTVAFTIARDGTVSNVTIEKSSGSASLDEATLTLVRHASPMPALPDSYKGNAARVKFPIDYKLSLIDQMF